MGARMHAWSDDLDAFADAAMAFARARIEADASPHGLPLGTPRDVAWLDAHAGPTITADGIGPLRALDIFTDVLEPSCLSIDHHGFLAFVPQAPNEVSVIADLVVSACSIYAGSWLEGSGAVWAENQVLSWLADLAGFPDGAGGCFVQGGTNGNLSAMVAAREEMHRRLRTRPDRWTVVTGRGAHASVTEMARVMDCDVVSIDGDRLTGDAVAAALADLPGRVACVVATCGSTNLGRIDRLDEVADACEAAGVWLHVDGAYGGAGLLAPSVRDRYRGIERADSFIVDPHKWLFAPFDACALLYRDPVCGARAHTQHGGYLEVLTSSGEWNPSDYGVQLSRRARGLPLWFGLAAHGTDAYVRAIEHTLDLARDAARQILAADHLELIEEPELSVVAFRRLGWGEQDYQRWSRRLLADDIAFVVASKHEGEPILRFGFINPRTTPQHVAQILGTLA